MELFPIIQAQTEEVSQDFPLYRDVKWNFEKGQPIFQNGSPVFVTGKEAIKTWIWKALITARRRYEIYTWDFGNDMYSLIGQNFTEDTKQSEAARYVREALDINPYITDVTEIIVEFEVSTLTVYTTVETIYGEVGIRV